jgi:glutamyl-tRNA reductase
VKPIAAGAVWRTCLRQIAFFEETSFQFTCEQEDEILRGSEALRFLLEVLTGLHSPVLGETEVLGQFRNFIELRKTLGDALFSEHRKWLQFLITEVKSLRANLICGLGSNSYGGLVRKHSKQFSSISILGSGHLACEILPWVTQKNSVQMLSRNIESVNLTEPKFSKIKICTYEAVVDLGEVVVIAAPLSDEQIEQVLLHAGTQSKMIFDLRGEKNHLPSRLRNSRKQLFTLQEMFAELAGSKKDNDKKINHIKNVIIEHVAQFMERSELRPMGWDDICA